MDSTYPIRNSDTVYPHIHIYVQQPKNPCTYIVYTWALTRFLHSSFRTQVIPDRYMDPVNPKP